MVDMSEESSALVRWDGTIEFFNKSFASFVQQRLQLAQIPDCIFDLIPAEGDGAARDQMIATFGSIYGTREEKDPF